LPLGAREPIQVDVRVIAATHRDLEEAIEQGQFREDLYYRLDVFSIQVPPLRDRKEAILELANLFLKKHANPDVSVPKITPRLADALLAHNWPGNVRELENLMRRFLIFGDASVIEKELARRACRRPTHPEKGISKTGLPSMDAVRKDRDQEEAKVILTALESVRWNRKQAARMLDMDYKALLYRMKRLGIDNPSEESPLPIRQAAAGD
jgi:two-component system response regulator AtoC